MAILPDSESVPAVTTEIPSLARRRLLNQANMLDQLAERLMFDAKEAGEARGHYPYPKYPSQLIRTYENEAKAAKAKAEALRYAVGIYEGTTPPDPMTRAREVLSSPSNIVERDQSQPQPGEIVVTTHPRVRHIRPGLKP